jgi:hypothetical protein
VAAGLATLFERDVEIVERLDDAQCRLRGANERLWSGLSPDAFGLVYDGSAPAGASQTAELIVNALHGGGPEPRAAVLGTLQQVHLAIHRAFCDYQDACEERRQLAVEVGELSAQLIAALCAAGWAEQGAHDADVHELSGAVQ